MITVEQAKAIVLSSNKTPEFSEREGMLNFAPTKLFVWDLSITEVCEVWIDTCFLNSKYPWVNFREGKFINASATNPLDE